MSQCKCDLRTKLVGGGCRYCNPQEYIDNLIESLEEQRTWVGLDEKDFAAINQSCLTKLQAATSAESILKEKNT